MIEVGIPVFKAKDTLSDALNSLVAQTNKRFITTLSIDGDWEDYNDIINEYKRRGLHIKVIDSPVNGGAGAARQKVLDNTQCDYIMFLDADDMLTPRAIEVLYTEGKLGNYDIIQSSIMREQKKTKDIVMASTSNLITWFHGKVYKVDYLKRIGLKFLPGLMTDEDAYFNAIAWESTKKKGLIDEILYIWRDNKKSITRSLPQKDYFLKNYLNYIRSQVEALKALFRINNELDGNFVAGTLINIYYFYMKARFYKCDENEMDELISSLKEESWMPAWLNEGTNWITVLNNIKPGQFYDNEYVIFYEETFNKWAARLLKKGE